MVRHIVAPRIPERILGVACAWCVKAAWEGAGFASLGLGAEGGVGDGGGVVIQIPVCKLPAARQLDSHLLHLSISLHVHSSVHAAWPAQA